MKGTGDKRRRGGGRDRVLVTGHALSDLDRMPDREAVAGLLRRVRELGGGVGGAAGRPVFYVMRVEKSEEAEERARKIKELMGIGGAG